jgi:CheY-like chemotaxis protein
VDQPSRNLASDQVPKKKRLLLVDANDGTRELRVEIMGKAGLEVDSARDTMAARTLWRANSYNLVLIDLRHDALGAAEFGAEIKTDSPQQVVAFLVCKPGYVSSSPNPQLDLEPTLSGWAGKAAMLLSRDCSATPMRGGFLEATLRMRAKRSLKPPKPQAKKTSAQSFGDAVRLAESKGQVSS